MLRPFENDLTWYDQPAEKLIRNGGFSGCDIDIVVRLPAAYDRGRNVVSRSVVYQLGSLQTLSYQSYNSKEAVRSLGFKNVKGYARGSRTIAGTLMFNQLYTHVLDDVGTATIIDDAKGILTYSSGSVRYYRGAPVDPAIQGALGENAGSIQSPRILNKRHNFDFSWDQNTIGRQLKTSDLPPFDIIAIFVNEYGHVGKMIIYGVDLVTEGGVLSIEDIYTEVSMQYVARDIEYFHSESGIDIENWRGISPFATGNNGAVQFSELYNGSAEQIDAAWDRMTAAADERMAARRLARDSELAAIVERNRNRRNAELASDSVSEGVTETTTIVEDPPVDDFVMDVAMESVRRQNPTSVINSVSERSVDRAISQLRTIPLNRIDTPVGRVRVMDQVDELLSGLVTVSGLKERLELERDGARIANQTSDGSTTTLMRSEMIEFIIDYLDSL